MMRIRLFKPRKNSSAMRNHIARETAKGMLLLQRKWANGMSKLAAKVSVKTQRILFALFTLAMTCHSTWLIYSAFNDRSAPVKSHTKLGLPITLKPNVDQDTFNQRELEKKKDAFKRYADSIRKEGGPDWDEFRRLNGLLADSLNTQR